MTVSRDDTAYDPEVDIDWNAPWRGDLLALPPERVSLYGSRIWKKLSEEQRRVLGLHEAVSMWSTASYLAAMLTATHLRSVALTGLNDAEARSSLAEVGGSTRSTTTFGKLVRVSGVTPYRLPRGTTTAVKVLGFLPLGASSNGATLLVEQSIGQVFAGVVEDPAYEPHVRQAMKIHASDSIARFDNARSQLRADVARSGRIRAAYHRVLLAVLANCVLRLSVSPQVYRAVGVGPVRGLLRSRAQRRINRAAASAPAVQFFADAGMLDGAVTSILWRLTGVVPAPHSP